MRVLCNECGKLVPREMAVRAKWMGKKVYICRGCYFEGVPALATRFNPRRVRPKCPTCGKAMIRESYWTCPRCGMPGATMKLNPTSLYQKFHGNPPKKRRKIDIPMPKKGTVLTALGRMPEIRYTPYAPSQYAGTTLRHRWGDIGRVMMPHKPLLVTDGKDLWIVPEKGSNIRVTSRGIIG